MMIRFKKSKCIGGIFLALLLCNACASRKPFAATNKVYEQQVESAITLIKAPLPKPAPMDSSTILLSKEKEKLDQIDWVGTTNFGLRKPNFVILHHTAQDSIEQTLHTFTLPRTQVSAHYVIDKAGNVYHILNDYLRAWHAGIARWGSLSDINSISIGIEIDNNGTDPYTEPQISNLLCLLDSLKTTYKIPAENFIGHGDIAPGRKVDPGVNFPWEKLAKKGFGLWYASDSLQTPPANFNPVDGLRILGYDTRNTPEAIKAFKRHFTPLEDQSTAEWSPFSLSVLYNLYSKKSGL